MNNLLLLLKRTKRYLVWMTIGVLLALATVLSNIALFAIAGWFIAAMATAGIAGASMNYFTPAAIIRFLAIIRTGGRYTERYVTHDVTLKVLSAIRVWFYHHLEPLAPAQLQGLASGDLLSRIQADIERLDNVYLRILLPIIVAIIAIPIVLSVTYYYDKTLALLLLISLTITGFILPFWMVRANTSNAQQSVTTSAELRTHFIDGVQGMRELILYQADNHHIAASDFLSKTLLDEQDKTNRVSTTVGCLSFLMTNLTAWLCLWLLIPQVANGMRLHTELPMLILLIIASFEIVMPMTLAFEQMPTTWASFKRLLDIVDKVPTRVEPDQHSPPVKDSAVCFSQVNFGYCPQTVTTLANISFNINSGEKIAFVGASGAGKSTIANLLLGFWQAHSGNITVFGHDISRFQGDDLRKHIATLSQHNHLFTGTIYANLMLANPDADEKMLDTACRTAGLTEFIADLPDGYDTWLGEAGTKLSGGQQRRLAIAQALLKPAALLILDEPGEGLDPATEQAVMRAVFALMDNKTVLLITHSPSMLKHMDRIYVMEQGRIVDSGTHDTLLKSSAFYQNQLCLFN